MLLVDEALLPFLLETRWHDDLTVLLNRVLQLTLDLDLLQFVVERGGVSLTENASLIFVVEVAFPQATSLSHELVSNIEVPVLLITVKLKIIFGVHAVNSHNTVVSLHAHVLDCGDSEWHHLFEVVHLVHVLTLVPETVWLINENKVFLLVVDHLGNVVEIHELEHDEDLGHVGGVHWSSETSLTRVLHVHVLTVVTISVFFNAPAGTVLELFGNVPPVPVISNPIGRGCTVTRVHLENIKSR